MGFEFSIQRTETGMAARKATIRKSTYLTPAQAELAERLMKAQGFKSFSDWVSEMIREKAEAQGDEWPDADVKWGGLRTPNIEGEEEP